MGACGSSEDAPPPDPPSKPENPRKEEKQERRSAGSDGSDFEPQKPAPAEKKPKKVKKDEKTGLGVVEDSHSYHAPQEDDIFPSRHDRIASMGSQNSDQAGQTKVTKPNVQQTLDQEPQRRPSDRPPKSQQKPRDQPQAPSKPQQEPARFSKTVPMQTTPAAFPRGLSETQVDNQQQEYSEEDEEESINEQLSPETRGDKADVPKRNESYNSRASQRNDSRAPKRNDSRASSRNDSRDQTRNDTYSTRRNESESQRIEDNLEPPQRNTTYEMMGEGSKLAARSKSYDIEQEQQPARQQTRSNTYSPAPQARTTPQARTSTGSSYANAAPEPPRSREPKVVYGSPATVGAPRQGLTAAPVRTKSAQDSSYTNVVSEPARTRNSYTGAGGRQQVSSPSGGRQQASSPSGGRQQESSPSYGSERAPVEQQISTSYASIPEDPSPLRESGGRGSSMKMKRLNTEDLEQHKQANTGGGLNVTDAPPEWTALDDEDQARTKQRIRQLDRETEGDRNDIAKRIQKDIYALNIDRSRLVVEYVLGPEAHKPEQIIPKRQEGQSRKPTHQRDGSINVQLDTGAASRAPGRETSLPTSPTAAKSGRKNKDMVPMDALYEMVPKGGDTEMVPDYFAKMRLRGRGETSKKQFFRWVISRMNLEVHSRCEGSFKGTWYGCTIETIQDDGTVAVRWDTGELTTNKIPPELRMNSQQYKEGEKVEILRGKNWMKAEIAAVVGNDSYNVRLENGGWESKIDGKSLRPPRKEDHHTVEKETQVQEARNAWAVKSYVEVYSRSKDKWYKGVITKINGNYVRVQYVVESGDFGEKDILRDSEDIRPNKDDRVISEIIITGMREIDAILGNDTAKAALYKHLQMNRTKIFPSHAQDWGTTSDGERQMLIAFDAPIKQSELEDMIEVLQSEEAFNDDNINIGRPKPGKEYILDGLSTNLLKSDEHYNALLTAVNINERVKAATLEDYDGEGDKIAVTFEQPIRGPDVSRLKNMITENFGTDVSLFRSPQPEDDEYS